MLVCYGGSHAATLAPVAAALAARGRVEPIALALTTAAKTFTRRGVPFVTYRSFVDPARDAAALHLGEELAAGLGADAVIDHDESVAYLGLSMAALIEEHGETEARARYARLGRHAFLQRPVLRRIVDGVEPRVIVATNSPKSERAAVLVGNERNIPTLIVPDLLADPKWETYGPFEARWYAAMNQAARDMLIRHHGAAPERVVITGQPSFDKSAALSAADSRSYTARMTGRDGDRPYLVLATTWDQLDLAGGELGRPNRSGHARSVVAAVTAVAGDHDIVVKPHPSEQAGAYAASGRLFVAPPDAELDGLLSGAEGLIAAGSTSAVIDALSLGKPTLLVQLDGKEPLIPAATLGVPIARSHDEVRRWIAGERPTSAAAASLRQNTGSAERIAALIERLAA